MPDPGIQCLVIKGNAMIWLCYKYGRDLASGCQDMAVEKLCLKTLKCDLIFDPEAPPQGLTLEYDAE